MSDFESLIEISRKLGGDPACVQGGGGNTSLKIDARTMLVKASGVELALVTAESGFVAVDYSRIRGSLSEVHDERAYTELVRFATKVPNGPRPSIETGFHALLGRAVVHTHSVWANLIACAEGGERLLAEIAPEALWIPYATPGLPLTAILRARLNESSQKEILVLQNHGLIVSDETPSIAWAKHEAFDAKVCASFKIEAEAFENPVETCKADAAHLLFPDQAVYLGHDDLRDSMAGVQTQKVYAFLRAMIPALGLTLHTLPPEEATLLLNMEAEKYRQKVARNG